MSLIARTTALLTIVAVLGGCASWTPDPEQPFELPVPRMSNDTVVLEVAFARIDPQSADVDFQFWDETDEQVLSNTTRRLLAANGIRCGLVHTSLPATLQRLLDDADDPIQSLSSGEGDGLPAGGGQRLHVRAGSPGKIVVRPANEESVAILTTDAAGTPNGRSFPQAECLFRVKVYPDGGGQVRLELVPFVEYGDVQQRVVGNRGIWMYEAGRKQWSYDDLRLEALLAPGQALVLGATPTLKGVGHQFFAGDWHQGSPQKVLLIRVQQTQRDALFESGDAAPLDLIPED